MTPEQGRSLYELCQNILMKGMFFEGDAGDKFRTMKVLDKRLYETIQNLVEKNSGQNGKTGGPGTSGPVQNPTPAQRTGTGSTATHPGVPPGTTQARS